MRGAIFRARPCVDVPLLFSITFRPWRSQMGCVKTIRLRVGLSFRLGSIGPSPGPWSPTMAAFPELHRQRAHPLGTGYPLQGLIY
jgi:hypothetical protein